jgi:hypothetical protein
MLGWVSKICREIGGLVESHFHFGGFLQLALHGATTKFHFLLIHMHDATHHAVNIQHYLP